MEFSIPMIRRLADSDDPKSFANKLRSRRFQRFEELIAPLPRPVRILDVGGTNEFWERRGWAGSRDFEITTLNLSAEERRHGNVHPVAGDATTMKEYGDKSFDVVFSNSVIEHLFTLENQQRMASEVRRVGKAYWVQTPNFWFPMEPHFHVPGWQWMPVSARVAMIRRRRCGWRGPCPDRTKAKELVREVRLMTQSELKTAFPSAKLIPERFCGLVKSWTALGGTWKSGS